jgi:hypothetical protein
MPIGVSMLRPSRIAVALAPFPRCSVIKLGEVRGFPFRQAGGEDREVGALEYFILNRGASRIDDYDLHESVLLSWWKNACFWKRREVVGDFGRLAGKRLVKG